MKHGSLLVLSMALVLGLVACAADAGDGGEDTKEDTNVEKRSDALFSTSGGLSNWCQAKLDCENNCIRMYPGSPIMQSQCKKIDKCASKCDEPTTFQ